MTHRADYPTKVWDGLSVRRLARDLASPSATDWDQIVSELIATQTELDRVSDGVATAKVTVSSAQILACNGTPVELIAAPGAGKLIVVDHISVKNVFNTAAYAYTTVANLSYTDQAGAVIQDLVALFLESVATAIAAHSPSALTGAAAATRAVENAAVVFAAPDADPTLGDGTLIFNLRYRTLTLA